VLYRMCLQDKDYAGADRYKDSWNKKVEAAIAYERSRAVADEFRTVKDWTEQASPRFY
jgi:hypothetical protein